ncbi:PREDICTED: uncharacterized protein LOC105978120 [Erythranthe guttata]|uniref:uncharacterized protein LOC105978120 n=1 Tax=Erythranthe guttata TaxID=4155 RepID=UPI00064E10EB|nr:PREDICTED: uncharacterized protein LOC105978120 [Erythranthe guttata]|eukprot:XP_012858989.1 PREDICTED: uncharacterized protein LOC105978120 [Erythranthe guttata]
MDGLSENLAKGLLLTNEEEEGITVTVPPVETRVVDKGFQLVGRVVCQREISAHSIKSNVLRLLQPVKACEIDTLGPNRFIIRFQHRLDYLHARSGCPWLVDKNALLFQDLDADNDPTSLDINMMDIVLRIHNLHLSMRTEYIVTQICSKIGELVEIIKPKPAAYVPYMRVKIRIDVTKSLKRGMNLHNPDGTKNWAAFSYERLPNFCFLCGVVGHGENRCPARYDEDFADPGDNLPYGVWMRATGPPDGMAGRRPLHLVNRVEAMSAGTSPRMPLRGASIFGISSPMELFPHTSVACANKENLSTPICDESDLVTHTIQFQAGSSSDTSTRKLVKVSNRSKKKKAAESGIEDRAVTGKKQMLVLRDEESNLTAETAMQSRRAQ